MPTPKRSPVNGIKEKEEVEVKKKLFTEFYRVLPSFTEFFFSWESTAALHGALPSFTFKKKNASALTSSCCCCCCCCCCCYLVFKRIPSFLQYQNQHRKTASEISIGNNIANSNERRKKTLDMPMVNPAA